MTKEKLIWDKIAKPIITFLSGKASGEIKKHFKRSQLAKMRKDYIKKIDNDVIEKYGDSLFYNKLSKCIVQKHCLEKIYDWAYNRLDSPFDTEDKLIDYILSNESWGYYDYSSVKNIFKQIINASFYVLNVPTDDSERKIINHFLSSQERITDKVHLAADDTKQYLGGKIDTIYEMLRKNEGISTSNISFDNLSQIYNLVAKSGHNIRLNLTNEQHFQIDLTVKYTGEIAKFKSANDYLNYLSFTGEHGCVEVVEIITRDNKGTLVDYYIDSTYQGLPIKFNTMYSQDVEILHHGATESADSLTTIEIIPELECWNIDIIDEDFNSIVSNIPYAIKRKIEFPQIIEVTLQDQRDGANFYINMINRFDDYSIVKSEFKIKINDNASFKDYYDYFILMRKLFISDKVMLRDRETGKIIATTSYAKSDITLEALDFNIDLCRKTLKLEAHFGVSFTYPSDITHNDVKWVNILYDMLQKGYCKIEKSTFSLDKSKDDGMVRFIQSSSPEQLYLFCVDFAHIEIWGTNISLDKSAQIVTPKSRIEDTDANVMTVIPESAQVLIYRPVYGEYVLNEVAIDILSGKIELND